MPGLVPGIHVFRPTSKDVDGRDKPGHDYGETTISFNLDTAYAPAACFAPSCRSFAW
jgi:hypothetical protein